MGSFSAARGFFIVTQGLLSSCGMSAFLYSCGVGSRVHRLRSCGIGFVVVVQAS